MALLSATLSGQQGRQKTLNSTLLGKMQSLQNGRGKGYLFCALLGEELLTNTAETLKHRKVFIYLFIFFFLSKYFAYGWRTAGVREI